ncbi:MAG: bifunctional [glutamate--ammonia ligase]-adenylyl-L-tyrosine phosphorylase/[glutamate--ammonia-ligase] adenylyltransferase [Candidatus Binataceae bacterium]
MKPKRRLRPELSGLGDTLGRRLGDPRIASRATALVAERAPDERLALAFLLQLAEHSRDELAQAMHDEALAGDLIFCLGASETVATELGIAGPGWLEIFFRARGASAESIRASWSPDTIEAATRHEAAAALARIKRRRFLDLAVADLLRRITVSDTALLMSELADDCIRMAYAASARLMGMRGAEAGGFCVVALGKLGARELNLSSDIDLVYLSDASDPPAETVAAARMGEMITEILAGGSFRVDLRLRPGGRNSSLVVPVEAALGFYQSLGQTWERAALLRARAVAGDTQIGARLLGELENFIYRRYLDFDTLGQLRAMKHQIEAELRSAAMVERNVKLGRGGIRELEFVVQSLTLIYGGRDPRIRTARTTVALERLAAFGYLPAQRARRLSDAYLFLRDVEHKLQIVAGRQTHTLPSDSTALRALATRLGFGKGAADTEKFLRRLARCRELVAAQFRDTLASGDEDAPPAVSAAADAAWSVALDSAQSAKYLEALGYSAPEASARHLELLARGPGHLSSTPRRRELIEDIGPTLLDEISKLADPDLAIMNLADFMAAVGARTSFLALLGQHPATRRVLLSLFASSRYLSTVFIRHPDMLDTLVRSDLARRRRELADLRQEVSGIVAANADFESKLDALRAFQHQEFLRIAIADLAGDLEVAEVETELTNLAEAVLGAALAVARDDVAARHPIPDALRLVVLAMGRLGAGEMTYNSDLDLIFVYDDAGDESAEGRMAASRIAQRLIATLESRTREGYAYKLDLRLRPSGNQGPLVTSLEGFREYHRQSSAVWERQALVRGRVVAGDTGLGDKVEAARLEFVYSNRITREGVAEIAAMRTRMEREIGAEDKSRINLKHGRGGLVDVEFLAQMMSLRHAYRYPVLAIRSTRSLIAALADVGLMAPADAVHLTQDFEFLTRLENRLRIESDQPAWAVPTNPAALLPLARRMGFRGERGSERMLAQLLPRRERIRMIFDRYFAAELARPE